MNDEEIMERLQWLYHERELCTWCRNPIHRLFRRGLCSSCYRLGVDFRKRQTAGLAIAIDSARREGLTNAADSRIRGLDIELLFGRIAGMAFPFAKPNDNPFFHSANTWSHTFTRPQQRLLFHYFSMVELAAIRRARRPRAVSQAMLMEIEGKHEEIREIVLKAVEVVEAVFGAR